MRMAGTSRGVNASGQLPGCKGRGGAPVLANRRLVYLGVNSELCKASRIILCCADIFGASQAVRYTTSDYQPNPEPSFSRTGGAQAKSIARPRSCGHPSPWQGQRSRSRCPSFSLIESEEARERRTASRRKRSLRERQRDLAGEEAE